MKIKRALIMNIGKTENDYILKKEAVLNSIESFINKPIVFNDKQNFKNYTDSNFNKYNELIVIGYIIGNIEVTDTEVYADIMIKDEYVQLWNGKYDNWCIEDCKTSFNLVSIEIF